MKNTRSVLSVFMLVLLIAATVTSSACAGVPTYNPTEANITSRTELGTGAKTITFLAVDKNNEAAMFTIHTDAEYLGEALLAHKLISGSDSQYGLMVDTVNGVRADYSLDGAYWSLWEDDAYANFGADGLAIKDGGCYSFVYTAA